MNSLILVNYFEKQGSVNRRLRELMAKAAQCLLLKEEQRNLENELLQENLIATMDVYDLEVIAEQLKLQYQQQCTVKGRLLGLNKHFAEFCAHVRNFDWDAQLNSKMELLQMQCENEMRELFVEYEAERQRRKALEQRPIVQTARATEKKVAEMQSKIESSKKSATARQAVLLEQLKELRNERNVIIVSLVAGREQIIDIETKLETMKCSNDDHIKKLVEQKQELVSKLRELNAKLPDPTTAYDVELSLDRNPLKIENSPTTTKFEAFLNEGNANNATVCEERKELSFIELFKEWETKRQLQMQKLVAITAKPFTENAPFGTIGTLASLEETRFKVNDSVVSKATPRSILRRPNITEEEDSDTMVPKKRVRFATPEMEDSEHRFMPSSAVETIADEEVVENNNDVSVIDERNSLFNGDTETIEILSTVEAEVPALARREELMIRKQNKPKFFKTNKLLKKARLQVSQKLNKMPKLKSAAAGKPKIEIQECRIIKPAGTKLPSQLPIELTPEPPLPTNQTISANTSQATQNKIFKSPAKPRKRKPRKMLDCDTFFRELIKQSNEDDTQLSFNADYKDVNEPKACVTGGVPPQTSEPSNPKRKKIEMDFESFFGEAMNSGESSVDMAAAMQFTSKDGDDDFLQFDLKFDENQGLLGDSVNDIFAGQANNYEKDDDDLLSFDFGNGPNEEKCKTDIFL